MKTKTKTKTKKFLMIILIIAIGTSFFYAYYTTRDTPVIDNMDYGTQAKEKAIESIKNRPEFSDRMNKEAEKIYYNEMKETIENKLKELEGETASKEKQALILKDHLAKYNPALVEYAETIVEFPRWIEAIGIIGMETEYCTAGVGTSKNNCGGIINSQTGKFKHYESQINSIEDIAILLAKPSYQNLSIAEMNGLYCQDETREGRKCEGWTERIEATILTLEQDLS